MESKHIESDENEISLIDLFAVLLAYKKMIIITTISAAVFIAVLSVISLLLPPEKSFMPNVYRPKAFMLIDDTSSQGGGLSAKLGASGLGGVAAMMGVSAGAAPTYSQLAIFLSNTHSFLDAVIEEFDLVTKYKVTSHIKTNTREALSSHLRTDFDEKTGVFEISFEDINPEFAKNVVLFCIKYYENKFVELGLDKDKIEKENTEKAISNCLVEINTITKKIKDLEIGASYGYGNSIMEIAQEAERFKMELEAQTAIYTQLKAKDELLKIKISSNNPILQVLEFPEVPDIKSGPSRGKLCVIVTFAAFFFSVFIAFLLNAIKNIKANPEAIAKLKGSQNEK